MRRLAFMCVGDPSALYAHPSGGGRRARSETSQPTAANFCFLEISDQLRFALHFSTHEL
jgi:hypothetical protein